MPPEKCLFLLISKKDEIFKGGSLLACQNVPDAKPFQEFLCRYVPVLNESDILSNNKITPQATYNLFLLTIQFVETDVQIREKEHHRFFLAQSSRCLSAAY